MSFSDDLQIARVNKSLCARMESFKGELWSIDPVRPGPTDLALTHLTSSPWSSGEQALLRFTFALWNSSNDCQVRDLWKLDCLGRIGELFVAMAGTPEDVDEWLEDSL